MTTALSVQGCSDSDDHGAPPRRSPTPTATAAVGVLTLTGTCAAPGKGPRGLEPCAAGTAVTIFHCDDRTGCLHHQGLSTLATTTVSSVGTWTAQVPAAAASGTLVFEAAIDDTIVFRTVSASSTTTATVARASVAPAVAVTTIDLSPVSEAAIELLDSYGFANYSEASAELVLEAVEQATAGLSFAGLAPDAAVALAVQTASADPTVLLALQTGSSTPTPTPAATAAAGACCACGGGCFQDTGSGCGECTAVPGAACDGSSCATFTPTATPTATITATATATAPPACCSCGGGCFQDTGAGCGDCQAVPGAACVDAGCIAYTATPTNTALATATGTTTETATATHTPTATLTLSPSATATVTATETVTHTHTPKPTATVTPTATLTFTGTATLTVTATATITHTPTLTLTPTVTHTATATPTVTATFTVTHTVTQTPTPTAEPACVPTSCQATSECACDTHTALFAIAHSYNDPVNTVLYRITIASWSPGANWGDGHNGFFYQVAVTTGGSTTTSTYVPFNGVGVSSSGTPQLPEFVLVVPAVVGTDPSTASLTVTACSSDYIAASGTTPACTTSYWTDAYAALLTPVVGNPPFSSFDFSWTNGSSMTNTISLPNTGVYAGALTANLSLGNVNASASQAAWAYNHLVFLDSIGDVYTNDLYDVAGTDRPSFGGLPITAGGTLDPTGVTMQYLTKYGSGGAEQASTPSQVYFIYSRDFSATIGSSDTFNVNASYIYDYLNFDGEQCTTAGAGGGAARCGSVQSGSLSLDADFTVTTLGDAGNALCVSTQDGAAGSQESRTFSVSVCGTENAYCTTAVNPLAINISAGASSAYNQPNYILDERSANGVTENWPSSFPTALYYLTPTGFGSCTTSGASVTNAPFCDQTSGYAAYTPQYDPNTGTLNGGSTTGADFSSFTLNDEYQIGSSAQTDGGNTLLWFDNCGYGYQYTETQLNGRLSLPKPPTNFNTYTYNVTDNLSYPIVFGKECCASFYQQNQTTMLWEPPQQIDNSNGVFVSPGQTLLYETLFSDEAMPIYNATTGTELFKLRLTPTSGAVYNCSASDFSVGISGTNPYAVTIGAAGSGSLSCGPVGLCPYGTTASQDGTTVTCTATNSSFLLGIAEWATEITSVTASVQLQAWGATGDNNGGDAGFALTVVPVSSLTQDLYGYVGAAYGASSILTTKPLSLVTEDTAGKTTDPSTIGVLLIAGGSGTSGVGGDSNVGGAGGVAIANTNPTGAAVSAAGAHGTNGGAAGGAGGNESFDGNGGSGANNGSNGVGGFSNETGWGDGGSIIPPQSWTAGFGPTGENDCSRTGGKGGGGFGGAGSGSGNCGGAGGGGGGGSWAAANTAYDGSAPTTAPTSPAGSGGAISFVYSLAAACSVSSSNVICSLPSSASSFDLKDAVSAAAFAASAAGLTATIDDNTPMWIRAWGGAGGTVDTSTPGGAQGLAQTVSSVSDYNSKYNTTQLYYYTGSLGDENHPAGKGGSSSIVASADLSANAACLPPTSSGCTQNILLIAGGGGGGGNDDGGAGGQAIAPPCTPQTNGTCVGESAAGAGAGSSDAGGGSGGTGGSANGTGSGGSAGSGGIGGMGGAVHTSNGASSYVGWLGPQPSTIGSSGEGGEGKHESDGSNIGAGGGGGWGGGGGGGAGGSVSHGGGGGGSYAVGSTESGSVPSESAPSSGNGAVEVGFLLSQ